MGERHRREARVKMAAETRVTPLSVKDARKPPAAEGHGRQPSRGHQEGGPGATLVLAQSYCSEALASSPVSESVPLACSHITSFSASITSLSSQSLLEGHLGWHLRLTQIIQGHVLISRFFIIPTKSRFSIYRFRD